MDETSNTSSPADAGNLDNTPPVNQTQETPMAVQEAPESGQTDVKPPKKSNLLLFLIPALVVMVIGVGVFAAYKFMKAPQSKDNPTTTATPTVSVTEPTSAEKPNPPGDELSGAHNSFGFSLLASLAKQKSGTNVIISPSSIELDFSMLVNGAKGGTLTSLKKTLGLTSIDNASLNSDSLALINYLKNPDPKVELSIANSIWTRKDFAFSQDFLNTNKKYYNAEAQSLDFADPKSAATINDWVSKNTKGKIPTIIEPPIDSAQVMFLINAIYFKGQWTKTFNKDSTRNDVFSLDDGSQIDISLMLQKDDFDYLQGTDFQLIRLPYGDNKNIAMLVLLPKKDLKSFLPQLTNANWKKWENQLISKEGTILLPKFKLEYKESLKDVLSSMGMSNAFTNGADFTGIAPNLLISDVLHKTFIEVNEEGTTAAAVTSINVSVGSVMENPPFYMAVNKPFFFTIEDKVSGEILFSGLVYNPSI